ncbi:MAG: glycosyltransferase family 2 protein [Candidatus Vogelbacteria bacterium]|nr:glycosyltransferase family 2 protein [Candidatus Vogelbacteria bacterium]
MKKPLISVSIPVFNGEKYIRDCVVSVLTQSEQKFEILILDNCSTDRSSEICNEFADPRIRILKNTHNVGSIENFCRCIQNATGEFFVLLPCDDLLEKDYLKLLSQGLIDHPSAGIAYGSTIQIDSQGERIRTNLVIQEDGFLDREKAVRMIAEKFNPIQHPMVRLENFSEIGQFDKLLGCFCDIHLWSKVLFGGWNAYVVSKPLTAIRCHEGQGQSLFRQNTKDNLKKLSGHYGQALTPTFYKKNHFNLLFFNFVHFFNSHMDMMLGTRNDLKNVMISHLVVSHLSNVYFSIRHANFPSLASEAALSLKLMKLYGPARMLQVYFSAIVSFMRKAFSLLTFNERSV